MYIFDILYIYFDDFKELKASAEENNIYHYLNYIINTN